jgi:hypothetical protein
MPHRRGMTAAARAFIDHIAAAFPAAMAVNAEPKKAIVLEPGVKPTRDAQNAIHLSAAR